MQIEINKRLYYIVHKENGKYHKENGPAIIHMNGSKQWFQNEQYHRLDGPAIEYKNGSKEWYIEGIEYSENDFRKRIMEINANNSK